MPQFVIPGLLAMVFGFLLVGIAILRSEVLPRWVAVLIIGGALAMLGANEQTAWVLRMIPRSSVGSSRVRAVGGGWCANRSTRHACQVNFGEVPVFELR
jgi:hypothetical protein